MTPLKDGTRLRVGINGTGGTGWIGGAYYLHNAARAFTMSGHAVQWFAERGVASTLVPDVVQASEFVTTSPTVRRLLRVVHGRGAHRMAGLEWSAAKAGIDVLAPTTRSLGARCILPWVGWIPDLQHRDLPHFFSEAERVGRDAEQEAMRREAPCIVFSSHHARRRFCAEFGEREALVVARFPAVPDDSWYAGDVPAALARHGIAERFVYLPNQLWQHKDHATAVAAWEQLGDRAPLLVCTGALEDYRAPEHVRTMLERMRSGPASSRIRVLGLVDRSDQLALYRAAMAVLNPSLYEGWSTTVEEARALGRPAILSNIEVFKEQMGDRAHFFEAGDARDLARVVAALTGSLPSGPNPASELEARQVAREHLQQYAAVWDQALRLSVERHRAGLRGGLARSIVRRMA
jgi:glycosyltransferase involved in cell wall biosynthesis